MSEDCGDEISGKTLDEETKEKKKKKEGAHNSNDKGTRRLSSYG